ncbi:MAG: glycosyltransferase, partial [Treponema sp.]|nr:glycosyltransferase [Treponema sp.]
MAVIYPCAPDAALSPAEPYSVLMAVYAPESPAYLRESIESILRQTLPAAELVLVCDGPLPAPLDRVVTDYAGRYRRWFRPVRLAPPVGLGPALREGLAHCTWEYIARMDSDDISVPERCERQLAFMKAGRL